MVVKTLFQRIFLLSIPTLLFACGFPYNGGGCFLADTRIQTENASQRIQDIVVGAKVATYDGETKSVTIAPVDEVTKREVQDYLVVQLQDGRNLHVTAEHPVYVKATQSWESIGSLSHGSEILVAGGQGATDYAAITEIAKVHSELPVTVYNLKVRHFMNAFADGVAAHFY